MPQPSSRLLLMLLAVVSLAACGYDATDDRVTVEQAASTTGVRGQIDGVVVKEWATWLRGWACDLSVAKSISVHVYVNGAAGTGTMLKAAVADQPSDAAVDKACGTTGVNHGFLIPITGADVRQAGGASVFVHGLSASGGANLLLKNSGLFALPKNQIIGNIDAVVADGAGYAVKGWACDLGIATSIRVDLYAGGFAGVGVAVAGRMADLPSEAAVNQACKTPIGTPHRFSIPLGEAAISLHRKKLLFAHGIRPAGTESLTHALLGQSGKLVVPDYFNLTWAAFKSRLPPTAALWEVPAHLAVTLDENVPNVPLLHVAGKLSCGNVDLALTARGLLFDGESALFECGTETAPYTKRFLLKLVGDATEKGFPDIHGCDAPMDHPSGPQAIVAKCGARLQLHGRAPTRTWTRLSATAEPHQATITLRDAVDWPLGSRVAIASTSFDGLQADEAELLAIDASHKVLTLGAPLQFRHLGETQAYSNGKTGPDARAWTLDESAEVALLSRNITIEGTEYDGLDDLKSKKGGSIMVTSMMPMQDRALAQVEGVELSHLGRLSELGRYPFHWHHAGTTAGDYLKNSTIHHSFQRCVVVHGTHNVLVKNNVCFDHYGHGFFLEDGNETKNEFRGNLGFVSRRPPIKLNAGVVVWNRGLLYTDNRETATDRWSSPATFWISNPDNIFEGNIAAGSEGTGFWFSLVNRIACDTDPVTMAVRSCRVMGAAEKPTVTESVIYPVRTPLAGFSNNVSHSGVVGVSTDGVAQGEIVTPCDASGKPLTLESNKCDDRMTGTSHYTPRADGLSGAYVKPSYTGLRLWRERGSGFYFRGDAALVDESVIAESVVGAFFDYNQTLRNSLVVGLGPFLALDRVAAAQANTRRFFAARLYDGPFTLENVHFAGFADRTFSFPGVSFASRAVAIGNVGGADKAPTNHVRRVTFAPDSLSRVDLDVTSATWPSGLRDDDGALTGVAGSTLIPYDPALNPDGTKQITSYPECTLIPEWNASRCPAAMSFGSLTFFSRGFVVEPPNIPVQPFRFDKLRHAVATNTDTVLGRFNDRQNKVTLPSYHAGASYRFFAGVDYGYVLALPAFDSPDCAVGATCELRLGFKYVRAGDRSPIVRLTLPPNTTLTSVTSLAQVATEAALETTPGYWVAPGSKSVSLRLEANDVQTTDGRLVDPPFNAYTSASLNLRRN